jgi:hypothetical protein
MTKSGTEMDKTAKPKRHKKELGWTQKKIRSVEGYNHRLEEEFHSRPIFKTLLFLNSRRIIWTGIIKGDS